MKKPIFRSKWVSNPVKGEEFTEPSMTVPDMSYSIQELFEKYVTFPEVNLPGEFDDQDIDTEDVVVSQPIEDLTDFDDARMNLISSKNKIEAKRLKDEAEKQASQTPLSTI